MTDWQAVIDDDFTPPSDRALPELVTELSAELRSPDPDRRDGLPYRVLCTWILNGTADRELERLGDEMADRFADPQIQARCFAPLVLAWIVARGTVKPQWLDAFASWYPSETDLRGRDEKLGWLHAVAHGADLLGEFGSSVKVDPAPLLDLAARRLVAPSEFVWREQEDDRLALAIAVTLTRAELTEAQAVDWLGPVATDFASGAGPPAPQASNAMRTLRALYILVDRGVRPDPEAAPIAVPHRKAVKDRLAEVLTHVAPFAG
ncbi:MAG: DUF2785 domain-containing protein [Stackebrandtia sp.]